MNCCLSSPRFLRRRPDVRSADAALRHPRQLLPGQHDSAQGQPGGPHHALAPSHLRHSHSFPDHLAHWTEHPPIQAPGGMEETETSYFSIPEPCWWDYTSSGTSCCHGLRYLMVRVVNTHSNSTVVFGFDLRCVCVCLVFFSQDIPLVFLPNEIFLEHANPL